MFDEGSRLIRREIQTIAGRELRSDRLRVYVHTAVPLAHAPSGPFVFLPLELVRANRAPWMHEAMHALLPHPDGSWLESVDEATATREMPLWLIEGVADYIAHRLSEKFRIAFPSPFDDEVMANTDRLCAARLRTPAGRRMLPFIGGQGRPVEIFGPDRFSYASVFYPCAKSFVAFLAGRHGLAALIDAHAHFRREHEYFETTVRSTLAIEKRDWCEQRVPHACGGADRTSGPARE